MKQIIVLIAMIFLGCYISHIVSDDGANTVKSALSNVWQSEIERQNTYP